MLKTVCPHTLRTAGAQRWTPVSSKTPCLPWRRALAAATGAPRDLGLLPTSTRSSGHYRRGRSSPGTRGSRIWASANSAPSESRPEMTGQWRGTGQGHKSGHRSDHESHVRSGQVTGQICFTSRDGRSAMCSIPTDHWSGGGHIRAIECHIMS